MPIGCETKDFYELRSKDAEAALFTRAGRILHVILRGNHREALFGSHHARVEGLEVKACM